MHHFAPLARAPGTTKRSPFRVSRQSLERVFSEVRWDEEGGATMPRAGTITPRPSALPSKRRALRVLDPYLAVESELRRWLSP
jgi:hypothetical protein